MIFTRLALRPLSLGLLTAVLATAAAAQQNSYRIVDLTPPNAGPLLFRPYIGSAGQTCVTAATSTIEAIAFLRTQQGDFIDLEFLPGATANVAMFLGRNGLPVGFSGNNILGTDAHAVKWDRWGNVTDLGVLPGDTVAAARDADASGNTVIGGSGTILSVDTRPFIWKNGVMSEVTIPGFPFGTLRVFGQRGSMAGDAWFTQDGLDSEGFILDKFGNVEMIGLLPGGTWTQIFDINNGGTVVGCGDDPTSPLRAVIYQDGVLTSLAPLPGHDVAALEFINNHGTAVGFSAPLAASPVGTVSYKGGPMIDLNTLLDPASGSGWLVLQTTSVNDRGEIVAGAINLLTGDFNVVLLTPLG